MSPLSAPQEYVVKFLRQHGTVTRTTSSGMRYRTVNTADDARIEILPGTLAALVRSGRVLVTRNDDAPTEWRLAG